MSYFPRWKQILIYAVCLFAILASLPNFLPKDVLMKLPEWWKPMTLGLDLQGGSQILLNVRTDMLEKENLSAVQHSVRQTLREKNIRYVDLKIEDDKLISLKVVSSGDVAGAQENLRRIDRENMTVTVRGSTVALQYTEQALRRMKALALEQSIEIVRRRVDEVGTKEPTIQRQGEDRILVQLPGIEDPHVIKGLLGKTAKMTFHMVDSTTSVADARRGKISANSFIVPGDEDAGEGGNFVLERTSTVGGMDLETARAGFSEGRPVVEFSFKSAGAKRFGALTRNNVGKQLAIVLDGKVISAPVINSPITGGQGIITGSFTTESASDLALLLRSGALPVPLDILEERSVGPGLGTDSIASGKLACYVGMGFIIVFMLLAYGKAGLFADVAMIFNVLLLLGVLSAMGATLTLPGIAGIALTMGMAIDANVLIYERMREEIGLGRTAPLSLVEVGFDKAFTSIFDSNITSLAAAVILFIFGSGPVKGFAVTLGTGILTSLFSAILITRLLFTLWIKARKPETIAL